MSTIELRPADTANLTNQTIQQVIDAVAAQGGGTVLVPAGVYRMADALHLRSGVQVIAQPGATLLKDPSVSSRLKHVIGYGHFEFAVQEPEKFRVGMGIHLHDDRSVGFYNTSATIIARRGEWFYINRMANHDYNPTLNGTVTSVFSLIEADGVENAGVQGFTLDGNTDETTPVNGCRGGAVFLIRSRGVTVANLEVLRFKGEGVSFQQCADIVVRDCHIHHVTGNGLHPGSGSVRYVMLNNRVHHCGQCGLFYCLRTSHSICRGNVLTHNGSDGISVGERDTDHLIEGNTIEGNGGPGIGFRKPVVTSGDRTLVVNNTLRGNGGSRDVATCEIVIADRLHDVHLSGNTIHPLPGRRAVSVDAGCTGISVVNNTVAGRAMTAGDVVDGQNLVQWTAPAALPQVGPAALPLDGALHLAWASLAEWRGVV
jgi:hypothetical protein